LLCDCPLAFVSSLRQSGAQGRQPQLTGAHACEQGEFPFGSVEFTRANTAFDHQCDFGA
jgi:hypothetical protein